jgi:glycosyltransferase involved in cell wall biosynthesis
MHTDWLEYAEQRIQPSDAIHNRLRRMLRGFYQAFDGVITLNEEHQALLTSSEFELPEESVIRSAHWPAKAFTQAEAIPETSSRPLRVIYTGRLSPEKGVRDLPKVWARVKKAIPNAELVLAGTGPISDELKHKLPDARFTGWLSQEELIEEFKHARCQILPSRFDTFGCVVVEAMCLGVPTVAYNCKGPKTIIEKSQAGMLVEHEESMADAIVELLSDESKASQLSAQAKVNCQQWSDSKILNNILEHLYR